MCNKALFLAGFKVIDDVRERLCNKVNVSHATQQYTENGIAGNIH